MVERAIWTCRGSVRGGCGVNHRSYAAARACCERDGRDVKRGHGAASYSDRYPAPVNDAARAAHADEVQRAGVR